MYTIELNGYDEPEHWAALNEKNVYLSYTADFGQHVINHMHKSCEILLVEQGGAEYTINGVAHQLAPGTIFVMGGLDAHKRVINEFPFVRYGLTLMPSYLESLPIVNEYLGVYRTQSYPDFLKLTNLPDPVFDEIRGLFLALGEETAGAQRGRSDMVYALLLQLTIVLTRLLNADRLAPTVNPAYKTMLEIRDYIDACYSEPLSLEQLARQFFINSTAISRGFPACFGTNISTYIRSVRITNAARRLESSSDTVTDVGVKVGYQGVNTFIRQFRETMGVTPLQYRKQFYEHLRARELAVSPRMPSAS